MEHYQSWIVFPKTRILALIKQCGIISTEDGTKDNRRPKKSFEMSLKKPGETKPAERLLKLQETLSGRVQAVRVGEQF